MRGSAEDPVTAGSRQRRQRGQAPWWRVASWALAVMLSLAVVAPLAWWSGLLSRNDLLDVFVGRGMSRYNRIAVFVVGWALVMSLLVTLFAGVGRRVRRGE